VSLVIGLLIINGCVYSFVKSEFFTSISSLQYFPIPFVGFVTFPNALLTSHGLVVGVPEEDDDESLSTFVVVYPP